MNSSTIYAYTSPPALSVALFIIDTYKAIHCQLEFLCLSILLWNSYSQEINAVLSCNATDLTPLLQQAEKNSSSSLKLFTRIARLEELRGRKALCRRALKVSQYALYELRTRDITSLEPEKNNARAAYNAHLIVEREKYLSLVGANCTLLRTVEEPLLIDCQVRVDHLFAEFEKIAARPTIQVVYDDDYQVMKKGILPPLTATKQRLCRGPQTHVALIKRTDDAWRKSHMTEFSYKENRLTTVDLIASRFLTLDLAKLIDNSSRKAVSHVQLHALWKKALESHFEKLPKEHLHNSTRAKLACLFGTAKERKLYPAEDQDMVCSEYLAKTISYLISAVNDELAGVHLTDPFEGATFEHLTPADVSRILTPFCEERRFVEL